MALITDNLISYWKFDDAATDSVADNDLTLSGSPSYATGKINNGLDLESTSSQYAYITDAAQTGLDITGTISISAWIKLESYASASYMIVNKGGANAATGGYIFYVDGSTNQLVFDYYSGTAGQFSRVHIDWTPSTGVWYHVAVTLDPSSPTGEKMYIDGTGTTVTVDSSGAASIQNNAARFEIGVHDSASVDDGPYGYFDGVIDEVGIWNRVLTETEITALYNGGSGNQYPFTSTNTTNFFQFI